MSLYIRDTDDEIDDGSSYLYNAADLWSLVDPRRGDAIRAWIRKAGSRIDRGDEDLFAVSYDVDSLRHLLGLLAGLSDALKAEISDDVLRLDPQTAARIKAQYPTLVDSWDVGGHVETLENRVHEVRMVESMANRAVELNRPLIMD